jgi:ubiquinone/menaquinone biosynthesis C-methylase UbiE
MSQQKGYTDPEFLRRAAEQLLQVKRHSYELLRIAPGQQVLDVGCGPGTDTIPLAALVGPAGRVVGVDVDQAMVAVAAERAAQEGISAWVQHEQADAAALPFAAAAFDASRSERLFQHLIRPAAALAEMIRVTKPGGRVVVLDTDWATMSIDSDEIDVERRLVRVRAEVATHNGYAARRLYRLFKQADLAAVAVEVIPSFVTSYPLGRQLAVMDETERLALESGVVGAEELERFRAGLQEAEDNGWFFASLNLVLVSGQRAG